MQISLSPKNATINLSDDIGYPFKGGGLTDCLHRGVILMIDHLVRQKVQISLLSFVWLFVFPALICADVPPKSFAQLNEAETIIVGTVQKIRVAPERSLVERGFGNYDWAIYVQISIEAIEKGNLDAPEIEIRCFRVKSRRSATESLSVTGHRPIPQVGTKVRVYLDGAEPILPNGITLTTASDDSSVGFDHGAVEAVEVRKLKSRAFTYFLPIEIVGLLVVGLWIGVGLIGLRRIQSAKLKSRKTGIPVA